MIRTTQPRLVFCLVLAALDAAAPAALAAAEAAHSFDLTYRGFGPVQASGAFRPGAGYAVRAEGCYAKHSEEAICGFTLRALRPIVVTNVENAAHASGADGSVIRTCCMFVQGDPRGYPITPASVAPDGIAVLRHPLALGQQVGLMLRVPNYAKAAPVAAVTFSRGQGDSGVAFATHVTELP